MGLENVRFKTSGHGLPVHIDVESHVGGGAYVLQLKQARWTDGGETSFRKPSSLIEYVLHPGADMEVVGAGGASDYAPLRGVSFFPSLSEVHCRWNPGRQRSLSCNVDLADLLADVEFDPERLPLAVDIPCSRLAGIFRRLAEEMQSPGFASQLQIQCLMISAAVQVARVLRPSDRAAEEGAGLSRDQIAALRELVEGSDAPLTLSEMARVCGVTPRRLSVCYRNSFNRTLRSYLASAKVRRAELLLAQGAPIKQVAHACGFLSVAAFTAAFRKATGATPARFRLG